ncbi:MAG: twin-arginine translocase TatA/TatE family subunit [Candidatus Glassbacteria bacterium]|nr:twin-arginine translocase TatA/TatE family subunit [Candidatus Glassbacteria bacterium]
MLPNLGYGEMILIGFLVLLLFGAKRLPEIGSSLGKSIKMFKKSIKDIQEDLPSADDLENDSPRPRPQNQSQSQQSNSYTQESPPQDSSPEHTKD